MNGHGLNTFQQQVLMNCINVLLLFSKNQHLKQTTETYVNNPT